MYVVVASLFALFAISSSWADASVSASRLYGEGGSQFVSIPTNYQLDCDVLSGATAYANTTERGCQAWNKDEVFATFRGANNGFDAGDVWYRICRAGRDPKRFRWACYASGDTTESWTKRGATLPVASAKVIGDANFYANCDRLPDEKLCPAERGVVGQLGCVAQTDDGLFQSTKKGNNCHAYVDLLRQVCAKATDDYVRGSVGCVVE